MGHRYSARRGLSVVMAAHNAEPTISSAIQALLAQEVDCPVELIVVDDGSADHTRERLAAHADDRLRIITLPRRHGRAQARDIAVRDARYDVIVIADADDVSLPGRLQAHRRHFDTNPHLTVAGGQILDLSADGASVFEPEYRFPASAAAVDAEFKRRRMGIAHPAAAFRRDWYIAIGGYDRDLAWAEDFDLFLRGWEAGRYDALPEPLIYYRRRGHKTSWGYWWESNRHHHAIVARYELLGAAAPTASIAPFLRRSSRWLARVVSYGGYVKYRAVQVARGQRVRRLGGLAT